MGQGISKLEVVNRMLTAIGIKHPESALASTGTWPALAYGSTIAGRMEELLDDVSRREQRKGFADNVIEHVSFTADGSGEVDLSGEAGYEQTLKVEPRGVTWYVPMALRGTKILHRPTNTTTGWGAAGTVECRVTIWIDFGELDPGTAEYIAAEAIREAQRRWRGDKQMDMELGEESTEAMTDADRPSRLTAPITDGAPLGVPSIASAGADQGR